jgi:hypothetical protein
MPGRIVITIIITIIIIIIIINSACVEYENKSDTGNNRSDWNRFKITQTVPEKHTRKARN